MSTFGLIPGAGGSAWYWSRVVPLLAREGHLAIAVDLPGDDDDAGLPEYTRLVAAAIGERSDVVLVAQSLGGFTAPMVCEEVAVAALIFVNAMIPAPGETPGQWWVNTGALEARAAAAVAGGYGDFDLVTYFLHDVPAEVAVEGEAHQRPEADRVFASPCAFASWPPIPVRVLAGSEDRFFPVAFQRTVAPRTTRRGHRCPTGRAPDRARSTRARGQLPHAHLTMSPDHTHRRLGVAPLARQSRAANPTPPQLRQ